MRLLRSLSAVIAVVAASLLVSSSASAAAGWRIAKTLPTDQDLLSVGVVPGASQAWAVGFTVTPDRATVPLILHLDGRWREVPAPVPDLAPGEDPLRDVILRAVFARTATDAWAVGDVNHGGGEPPRTLIEHWDGASWRVVPSPGPIGTWDAYLRLQDVVALAADDAWAVGTLTDGLDDSIDFPIVLHWDGATWSLMPSADLGDLAGSSDAIPSAPLYAIARVGQTLVAVGAATSVDPYPDAPRVYAPLIERFKAGSWMRVASPDINAALLDVASVAWNDAWAVGSPVSGQPAAILHYDGTKWTLVPGPTLPSGAAPGLTAVSAVTSNDVWAVGNGILHWDGASWNFAQAPTGTWTDVSMRRNSGYGWAIGLADSPAVKTAILQHIPH